MEWTHTPNIAVAPRGIGYASSWERAARGLNQHMSDEHPITSTRTAALMATLGIVLAVVALVLSLVVLSDEPATPTPAHSPSSSSTTWSEECTAEDLDDGACYTWDDIRDAEWQSQTPSPTTAP